jgi:4-hydroxybenzoate polyprenyltransferase
VQQMKSFLRAMRPAQWTKNGLVFAGALFSHSLTLSGVAWRSLAGFACFCLLSGAVYVINDLRDLEADRQHPVKRLRPLASGALSPRFAFGGVVVLLAAAGGLAAALGPGFGLAAAAFLAVNLLYTIVLKGVVLLDVIFIALGFVLRAIAGVELIRPIDAQVMLSPWLVVCTFFLALFLGFGKRRQEIVVHTDNAAAQRAVLRQYSIELLDELTTVCAGTTLLAYTIYTIWPATVSKFHSQGLLYTVPFVAYGLFRYLWLVRVRNRGEDPSQVLVRDVPLLVNVALWAAVVGLVLYTG